MKAIPPRPGFDWSGDERAELRRLAQLCDASQDWCLECSHTDAGDPWWSSTISNEAKKRIDNWMQRQRRKARAPT